MAEHEPQRRPGDQGTVEPPTGLHAEGCAGVKRACRRHPQGILYTHTDWLLVVPLRSPIAALTEPCFCAVRDAGRRAAFQDLEGSRRVCRPIPPLPAAIAGRR